MGAASGGTEPSLIDRLMAEPHEFSFFQAVRLLEKYCPAAVGVGHDGPPGAEAVTMGVSPELGFPKSDVAALETLDSDRGPAYRLVVNFLGLHGASSPLPNFYAEEVLYDDFAEGTLRAFLDIFHHRILSLFYRSWLRFRHHFLFAPGGTDDFSRAVYCLVGLGNRDLIESAGFPAVRLLHFAGLTTQKPHSAVALKRTVREYFDGVGVRIIQALGRWLPINVNQRAVLGQVNCRLDENLMLGERVYDRQSKFRVVIGPLDYESYKKFLPGGEHNDTLKKLIKIFSTDMLDFDVELILRTDQTAKLRLDLSGESQLGWTTGFYTTEKARKDVAVVFA